MALLDNSDARSAFVAPIGPAAGLPFAPGWPIKGLSAGGPMGVLVVALDSKDARTEFAFCCCMCC